MTISRIPIRVDRMEASRSSASTRGQRPRQLLDHFAEIAVARAWHLLAGVQPVEQQLTLRRRRRKRQAVAVLGFLGNDGAHLADFLDEDGPLQPQWQTEEA